VIALVKGEVAVRRPDHAADAFAVAICHANHAAVPAALAAAAAR